ncbi:hypothetical protein K502DRAFT_364486 [Neoconidiobolus thromboides FSU 785]|nr:hypothetical protein K502DRAFT_364486 [Neoconidiobolus thromboides FSU 785]
MDYNYEPAIKKYNAKEINEEQFRNENEVRRSDNKANYIDIFNSLQKIKQLSNIAINKNQKSKFESKLQALNNKRERKKSVNCDPYLRSPNINDKQYNEDDYYEDIKSIDSEAMGDWLEGSINERFGDHDQQPEGVHNPNLDFEDNDEFKINLISTASSMYCNEDISHQYHMKHNASFLEQHCDAKIQDKFDEAIYYNNNVYEGIFQISNKKGRNVDGQNDIGCYLDQNDRVCYLDQNDVDFYLNKEGDDYYLDQNDIDYYFNQRDDGHYLNQDSIGCYLDQNLPRSHPSYQEYHLKMRNQMSSPKNIRSNVMPLFDSNFKRFDPKAFYKMDYKITSTTMTSPSDNDSICERMAEVNLNRKAYKVPIQKNESSESEEEYRGEEVKYNQGKEIKPKLQTQRNKVLVEHNKTGESHEDYQKSETDYDLERKGEISFRSQGSKIVLKSNQANQIKEGRLDEVYDISKQICKLTRYYYKLSRKVVIGKDNREEQPEDGDMIVKLTVKRLNNDEKFYECINKLVGDKADMILGEVEKSPINESVMKDDSILIPDDSSNPIIRLSYSMIGKVAKELDSEYLNLRKKLKKDSIVYGELKEDKEIHALAIKLCPGSNDPQVYMEKQAAVTKAYKELENLRKQLEVIAKNINLLSQALMLHV